MLLMIPGKGCWGCPFLYHNERRDMYCCGLSLRATTEGELPEFEPGDKKPKECPFAQFTGTLEIQAEYNE